MKNLLKSIIILFSITINTNAQSNLITIGYVPTIDLDAPTLGLHLGYNKTFLDQTKVSPEVQASYTFATFEASDDFFAHGEGSLQILSALAGSRFYFFKREKPSNLYGSLLVGYSFFSDKNISNDITVHKTEHTLGFSTGLYYETKNRLTLGVAVESDVAAIIKLGVRF